MSAYVVLDVTVHNPDTYERYKELTPPSLAAYNGRYLVRGGAVEPLDGNWQPSRLVVLEFPSVAQARAWWESPEYAPAKALRQACARAQVVLADGVPEPLDGAGR